MKRTGVFNTVLILTAMSAVFAIAEVRMPGFFGDNMVLQRDRTVPVWGWAEKGEKVTVEFAGQKVTAKAGDEGKWMAELKSMKASAEGLNIVVTSSANEQKATTISNVVVGDVWLCSGQSNMEWTQNRTMNAAAEAAAAAAFFA